MYRNYLISLIILLTILLNCFLIYGLLWNPYNLYFDRPEFSKIPLETRDFFAEVTTNTNLIILLGLTVVMIVKYYKEKSFFIPAPLFSLITLFLLLKVQSFYPDGYSEYTKDGYQYLEQTWYVKNGNTFKKFKSEKPVSYYSGNHRAIVWQLVSVNE